MVKDVCRGSETQLRMGENLTSITKPLKGYNNINL